ncbi:MAG: single-stranded-DNA-specific exonuclease RecJ [Cyanobacteriota bacterium]
MTLLSKKWKYIKQENYSEELLETCNSKIIAQLLANRGINNPIEAEKFLNISEKQLSSSYEFEDMPKVVERIEQAITKQEHILIYGDFDADGITGTSILLKTLRHIGANVSFYVPERVNEGHGINTKAILQLISIRKVKLIITTDCGISNYSEIALAKDFNVDVIITDHHELPDILPPAFAIINPKMLVPKSKMIHLCGAGVAYKVSYALLEYFDKLHYVKEIIYLAAIGTIADLVPLILENRVITYLGIQSIINEKPLAISEIAKTASIEINENFSSETIAFHIGPRLNAIGRLDNASIAIQLLTTEDPDIIQTLAERINLVNQKRKELCEKTYNEACLKLNEIDLEKNKAIILADKNWHPGVIGIVASKLIENFYRPTFLMSIQGEEVRGSARSIEGVHLFNVLSRVENLFTKYGGHELAAGFNLTIDNIKKFENAINFEVNNELENIIPEPVINIEMDVKLDEIDIDLINTINKLAPFGIKNNAPLFSSSDIKILSHKTMGSDSNHLKLFFKSDNNIPVEAVWWQHNSLNFDQSMPVNIAYYLEINTFMDKTKIQLNIQDIKPAIETTNNITKPSNTIKWVDHRSKTDINKLFQSYLKLNKSKIAIFAENENLIDHIKLDCPVINRLKNENYDQLILFEYPCDKDTLKLLLFNLQPKIIHLVPYTKIKLANEIDLIKIVYKMLKFAKSHKNSEANLINMAAKLGTSIKVISAVLDVLIAAKIIQITSFSENTIKFILEEFTNINLLELEEIKKLKEELLKVTKYKTFLYELPIVDYQFKF